MAIEKINRGRKAKTDNEKKSCTLLYRSQGSLIQNVSFHSRLIKSMSSGTNFALGITCPVALHMCRVFQLHCYVATWLY